MKGFTKIGVLLIVTAFVAGGVVYWLSHEGPASKTMVTVESIRKVAQLATVEYSLSTLVEKEFKSSIAIKKVHSSTLLALYSGRVRGWVNLDKVQIKLNKESDKASSDGEVRRVATIHFPRGSIAVKDVAIDPDMDHMTERVIWKRTGFNPPTDNQREGVRRKAMRTILKTAIEKGIVQKTKANAKMILTEFLAGFGIEAEVSFDKKAYDP